MVEKILTDADTNGDGEIDFPEFMVRYFISIWFSYAYVLSYLASKMLIAILILSLYKMT